MFQCVGSRHNNHQRSGAATDVWDDSDECACKYDLPPQFFPAVYAVEHAIKYCLVSTGYQQRNVWQSQNLEQALAIIFFLI